MVHSVTFKRPSSQAISQRDPVQPPIKKAKVNGSRQEVFGGVAWKTRHGVTQEDLLIHNGRLITKHELDKYRRQFVNNGLARWMVATVYARQVLNLKGFVSVAEEMPADEPKAQEKRAEDPQAEEKLAEQLNQFNCVCTDSTGMY